MKRKEGAYSEESISADSSMDMWFFDSDKLPPR